MSLTLITQPRQSSGTTGYCNINAANNPIIFQLQRKDYVKTSGFDIVNISGKVAFDLVTSTATKAVAGDLIYFYSGGSSYVSGFYEVLSIEAGNKIKIDLTYVNTGHANDFINVNADFPNYYAVMRLLVGTEYYYQKASPNSTGLITIDVSGIMRRLLSYVDEFSYTFNTALYTMQIDHNICKNFTIAYTERYTDSTDFYLSSSTIFTVNHAAISHGEDSNLVDFYQPKEAGGQTKKRYLTAFKNPVWFQSYPFDLGAFIEFNNDPDIDYLQYFELTLRDINKSVLSIYPFTFNSLTAEAETPGLLRIIFPSHAGNVPNYPFMNAELIDVLGYWKNGVANVGVRAITVKHDFSCKKNPIYVKWLNKYGGYSYWLFDADRSISVDNQGGNVVLNNQIASKLAYERDFTVGGTSNRVLSISESNLDSEEMEAWLDFAEQSNVWVLRNKSFGSIVSWYVVNTFISFKCSEPHGLKDGDKVKFIYNNYYSHAADYTVYTYANDPYSFYTFSTLNPAPQPTEGIQWQKVLSSKDWVLHRKTNDDISVQSRQSAFGLSFDLIAPQTQKRLK